MLALVLVVLFVNFRLRDSRLGRAWIALREDEVAAASMGVPLVKTKLLAYAAGGAFGGISGAFLGSFYNTVNADQFQFSFSIFILAMVILGGLGSIWGVVLGAVALCFVNHWLIPDVLDGEFVRASSTARPGLHLHRARLRRLRLPARDDDGAQTRGPAARAPAQARADRRAGAGELEEPGEIASRRGARATATARRPLLATEHVTKAFGGLVAVDDVSFDDRAALDRLDHRPQRRRQDDLLQHAHRALQADAGRITFDGKDITGTRPGHHHRAGHRAHVPEHPPVRDDDARSRT